MNSHVIEVQISLYSRALTKYCVNCFFLYVGPFFRGSIVVGQSDITSKRRTVFNPFLECVDISALTDLQLPSHTFRLSVFLPSGSSSVTEKLLGSV